VARSPLAAAVQDSIMAAVTPQPSGKATVVRDRRSLPERKTQLDWALPGGVLHPRY
jgi:hypothetical protein